MKHNLKSARRILVDFGWSPMDAEQFDEKTCIRLLSYVIGQCSGAIGRLTAEKS